MNGKQAKRLRRAALGLAATLTEAGKDIKRDGYQVKVHDNRLRAQDAFADKLLGADTPDNVKLEVQPSYQVVVRPDSAKGIYRRLKAGKV